jgi:endonuclease/exonuclease/phosphatase family metal-dependent hydrolase
VAREIKLVDRLCHLAVWAGTFWVAGVAAASGCAGDEPPDSVIVATWNVEWLYDDDTRDNRSDIGRQQSAPNAEAWQWKKRAVARVISQIRPDILCLQEVENRDVVYQLCQQLRQDHDLNYRYAFIPGYDFGTEQNVVVLYQSGLVEYSRREQTREMFESRQYYNLSKHLFARFQWGHGEDREELLVFNGHLRARPERADLRRRQAQLIHFWLARQIAAGENVIVTGDFNTEEDYGAETDAGEVAVVRGLPTASLADDLLDAHHWLEPGQRMTHISGRQYDRMFYSRPLGEDDPRRRDLVLERVSVRRELVVQGTVDENHFDDYYEIPREERDIRDHYPLVVEFAYR